MDSNEIKAVFQLQRTTLMNLNVSNSLLEYNERDKGERSIDVAYKVIDIFDHKTDNIKVGVLDLIIKIRITIEGHSSSIDLTTRGLFTIDKETSNDSFTEMLKINGAASLYSMSRATVSILSTQMYSIGNIVLPMLDFVKFHEAQ